MHPLGDLSAYLDGALSSEDRTSVQAHLDTCGLCRTRLAELRGTARLIAALPMPVPSRSLVPRVSVPIWLAPLRTFSTFASGAAIFLFLATAILTSFPRVVGTTAGSAPAGAPAANTASAPQASSGAAADSATGDPAKFQATTPSPAPSPATSQERSVQGGSPTPPDASQQVGRQDAQASSSTALAADSRSQSSREQPGLFAVTSPWLWLAVGLLFAALSFILSRRLRSA